MDGLGAQARQAARTQPAAARRERHDLPADRRPRPPVAAPADVRYVITLDADTRLPRGSGAAPDRQDGAPAEPAALRSRLRPRGRGPRHPAAARDAHPADRPRRSLFQRVFSGASGIDPYAVAVSDVYQDLFDEGSYVGKGIYDVDAFEARSTGRIPDGTLLSHDLLEGIFARAGLASDVEVVEEFPAALRRGRRAPASLGARRLAAAALDLRSRRRGATSSGRGSRQLPLIGRWKMLDNLRRSLSAPRCVRRSSAAGSCPLRGAASGRRFMLVDHRAAGLLPVLAAIMPRRAGIPCAAISTRCARTFAGRHADRIPAHLPRASGLADDATRSCARCSACSSADATCCEWVTAAQSSLGSRLEAARCLSPHVPAACSSAGVAAVLVASPPAADLVLAAPVLVLWLVSPALARLDQCRATLPRSGRRAHGRRRPRRCGWSRGAPGASSRPSSRPRTTCCRRTISRKIHSRSSRTAPRRPISACICWPASARATSAGSARSRRVERLEATLATMQRLQRFRGHFHNWYDTRDLRPLDPRYVSTVDSGNLAAHLMALANACRELGRAFRAQRRCRELSGAGDAPGADPRGVPRDPRAINAPSSVGRQQFESTLAALARWH